jgi:hypothetical protein
LPGDAIGWPPDFEPAAFFAVRRVFLLLIALPFLLAGTFGSWRYRFERVQSLPTLGVAEMVAGAELAPGVAARPRADGGISLELARGTGEPPRIQRLNLPGIGPADFLHVELQVGADRLVPGQAVWEDGRLMIEWHAPGHGMEPDILASVRGHGVLDAVSLVCRADHGPALPVLRLENLGASGVFRVLHCRLTVVRQTLWWKLGRWVLLAAWLGWAAAVAGWGRTSGPGRPLLAAGIWLLLATQVVLPGPWQSIRPLGAPFAGVASSAAANPPSAPLPPLAASPPPATGKTTPDKVESLGRLPMKGSLLLRIKDRIQQARPLLHGLLFFAPALAFALLVGRWRAALLAALLALGIEWAQVLFGYGFDPLDLIDLACDAAGIALALAIVPRVARWPWMRKFVGG